MIELSHTLREVLAALEKREAIVKMDEIKSAILDQSIINDVDLEYIFDLPYDEAIKILERPPIPEKVRGWRNFAWGKNVVHDNRQG